MSDSTPDARTGISSGPAALKWLALILATFAVSAAFLGVIQSFIMTLLLAAISAALLEPVFRRVDSRLDRPALSSVLTLLFALALILVPLFIILAIAAAQAALLAESASATFDRIAARPFSIPYPQWWPEEYRITELGPNLISKLGELAANLANFMLGSLQSIAGGTARFFLDTFVFLYALFFFLQMNPPVARIILSFTGLSQDLQTTLWERVVSISRATLKGTLVIGAIQGALGGFGFWMTGLGSPAFWGVVMAVVSVIPGVGPTLVIAGGVIALAIEGSYAWATVLAIWGFGVVGTVDNVLRPMLVGRDAKLPDILILVSTLGGLGAFGAAGLIIGPVIAGLFIAIWQTMRDVMSGEDDPAAA